MKLFFIIVKLCALHITTYKRTNQAIKIDGHYIEEKLDNGLIATTYTPYGASLVDVVTMGHPIVRFRELTNKLGLIYIHSSTREKVLYMQ